MFQLFSFCENGNLQTLLFSKHGRYLNQANILSLALDILDGLIAMKKRNIYWGDLNPLNIFLDKDWKPKMANLELSNSAGDKLYCIRGAISYLDPLTLHKIMDTNDSECSFNEYNTVYSLGVLIYVLLHKRLPFGSDYITVSDNYFK